MERMEQLKAMLSLCLIFGVAFCLGSVVGHTVSVRDQAVMVRPAQKDWGLSISGGQQTACGGRKYGAAGAI